MHGGGNFLAPEEPSVTPETPEEPEKMTFEDFLRDHKKDGQAFFENTVRPQFVPYEPENFQAVRFSADEDDRLARISYAYIEKGGETARTFYLLNISLTVPLTWEEVVERSASSAQVSATSETVFSLEYDARRNAMEEELSAAVYARFEGLYPDDCESGSQRIYSDTIDREKNLREINVLQFDGAGSFHVFYFRVADASYSDEEMTENFLDFSKYDEMHRRHRMDIYAAEGEEIAKTPYTAEQFEEQGGGGEDVATPVTGIDDLLTNYASEVLLGLQSVKEGGIYKEAKSNLPGFSWDRTIDDRWDFVCDDNGNITKIHAIFTLLNINTQTYGVVSVTPAEPIEIAKLTNKNIAETLQQATTENAVYTFEHNFNYTKSEQAAYQELAETVFEKEGIKLDGATYFISHPSYTTDHDLHEVESVTFVQITDTSYRKLSLIIQDGENYTIAELVSNVKNGKYRVTARGNYGWDWNYAYGGHILADAPVTAEP